MRSFTGLVVAGRHELAYVTFANGNNEIAVFDVAKGRAVKRFRTPGDRRRERRGLGPRGEIALSGTRGGISDLFLLDPCSGRVRQLTDDRFADLQPAWSPDGRTLAFASDRGGTDFDRLTYAPMRLATIDVESGTVRTLLVFEGAKHITPQFAPDARSLFLSPIATASVTSTGCRSRTTRSTR